MKLVVLLWGAAAAFSTSPKVERESRTTGFSRDEYDDPNDTRKADQMGDMMAKWAYLQSLSKREKAEWLDGLPDEDRVKSMKMHMVDALNLDRCETWFCLPLWQRNLFEYLPDPPAPASCDGTCNDSCDGACDDSCDGGCNEVEDGVQVRFSSTNPPALGGDNPCDEQRDEQRDGLFGNNCGLRSGSSCWNESCDYDNCGFSTTSCDEWMGLSGEIYQDLANESCDFEDQSCDRSGVLFSCDSGGWAGEIYLTCQHKFSCDRQCDSSCERECDSNW